VRNLTILLKVEWRVKHQIFEILLCFPVCLFVYMVCLSVYFVCVFSLSVSSLCSVFLLCLLCLSALNVCSVFWSVWYICLSFLYVCSLSLFCVPALSVYSVCQPCRLCLFCLSALSVSNVFHPRPLPHCPNKCEFVVIRSRQYETRNNTTKFESPIGVRANHKIIGWWIEIKKKENRETGDIEMKKQKGRGLER
jgi:hypothetical protein